MNIVIKTLLAGNKRIMAWCLVLAAGLALLWQCVFAPAVNVPAPMPLPPEAKATLQNKPREPEPPATPSPIPEPADHLISVFTDSESGGAKPTSVALAAIANGRLVVETEFVTQSQPKDMIDELLLRGGKIIIQNNQTKAAWLLENNTRIRFDKVLFSKLAASHSLVRPRRLTSSLARLISQPTDSQGADFEIFYCVMPSPYEASFLAALEAALPSPIADYSHLSVKQYISEAGYLAYELVHATCANGQHLPVNKLLRDF